MNHLPTGLQTQFLQSLRESETTVAVYLVNGIRLQGKLEFFDNYIVAVRHDFTQLVYKHSISTIVPMAADGSAPERAKVDAKKPVVTVRTRRVWSVDREPQ